MLLTINKKEDNKPMSSNHQPTFWSSVVFWIKSRLLMVRRGLVNCFNPAIRQKLSRINDINHADLELVFVAESITPLWTEKKPAEQVLQLGKVENLRLACQKLHQLYIPAGQIFSFWRQVGRLSRRRGYVAGRELRQGCIIPTIGGGICQLSNALYDTALKAGCHIIERHAHSQIIPGSLAEQGRDATVFWNYIDLRFCQPTKDLYIECQLTQDMLRVCFYQFVRKK